MQQRFALRFVAFFALVFGCAPSRPATVPCCDTPHPSIRASAASSERPAANGVILVVGDTQRTSLGEALLGRESNEVQQHELVARMAGEPDLAYVLHLGDMVVEGGSEQEWAYYSGLMAPLAARGLPVYPVLGNHDYSGPRAVDRASADPLSHARRYSPELAAADRARPRRTYYSKILNGLALVFLDSNLHHDAVRGAEQIRWLEAELRRFDDEAAVRAVLVLSHHPPFTNGKNRRGDDYMRREVVPRMLASDKVVALLSGHVHGYERFSVGGKTFVVSGGGGGPRVEYLPSRHELGRATYTHPHSGVRPLHYLLIRDRCTRLEVTVRCLCELGDEESCPDGTLDTFSIALPVSPNSAATHRCRR